MASYEFSLIVFIRSITGSLCTIDICLRRLEDVGTIDVQGNGIFKFGKVSYFAPAGHVLISFLFLFVIFQRYGGEDTVTACSFYSDARSVPFLPHCHSGMCCFCWTARERRIGLSRR